MPILRSIRDVVVAKIRQTDPKLVAAGAAYLLTVAAVKVLGLDLGDQALPGYPITWGQVVALAAAGAAGWWKSNAATILRTPQESGNPVAPEIAKKVVAKPPADASA